MLRWQIMQTLGWVSRSSQNPPAAMAARTKPFRRKLRTFLFRLMTSYLASVLHPGHGVFQAAFGVDQEIPRSYNRLSLLQPGQDHHAILQTRTELYFAWFEITVAHRDEHDLLGT